MKILLRADGSTGRGSGHLMRGLALAQAARAAGDEVSFVVAEIPAAVRSRLTDEGFEVLEIAEEPASEADARRLAALANERGARWIVLDGYHFALPYQRITSGGRAAVLVVDDHAQIGTYDARLILDQNPGVPPEVYRDRSADCDLLMGPRHALLRREFLDAKPVPVGPEVRRVLLNLGGADAANVTGEILRRLVRRPWPRQISLEVLVGPANPHRPALEAEFATNPELRPRFLEPTRDMPGLFGSADLVITAGGTSCWELCRLGRPMVVLAIATNQDCVLHALETHGAAIVLGSVPGALDRVAEKTYQVLTDEALRMGLAERARALIDGRGSTRVHAAMVAASLDFRPAGWEDVELIWRWANEPEARRMSFATEPIPLETHRPWFRRKLDDPDCRFLVGMDADGRPVGQARFDRLTATDAMIGVSLDRERRGQGLGAAFIERAVKAAGDALQRVHAYIKSENLGSIRAFVGAGFEPAEPDDRTPAGALHLVLERVKR